MTPVKNLRSLKDFPKIEKKHHLLKIIILLIKIFPKILSFANYFASATINLY